MIHQTPLEKKLLEDVIRPSITTKLPGHCCSANIYCPCSFMSETLNFTDLLRNIKDFYYNNGGRDWHRMLLEADI